MHELSVALEICRIAESQAGAATGGAVCTVGVDVGDDAGVDVDNLTFCLEALLLQPPFGHAAPVVRRVAGRDLRVTYLEVDDDGPDDPAP